MTTRDEGKRKTEENMVTEDKEGNKE